MCFPTSCQGGAAATLPGWPNRFGELALFPAVPIIPWLREKLLPSRLGKFLITILVPAVGLLRHAGTFGACRDAFNVDSPLNCNPEFGSFEPPGFVSKRAALGIPCFLGWQMRAPAATGQKADVIGCRAHIKRGGKAVFEQVSRAGRGSG